MKSIILLWQMIWRHTIYALVDSSDGNIFYVGKTQSVFERFSLHLSSSYKRKTLTQKVIHRLKKNVHYIVIAEIESSSFFTAAIVENYWIDYYAERFHTTNYISKKHYDEVKKELKFK